MLNPWTHEELRQLIPKLKEKLDEMAAQETHEVRPMPPMTADEVREHMNALLDVATTRPLTTQECFMHGQLQCCFEMAIRAEMLGKKGRYFVIPVEKIDALLKEAGIHAPKGDAHA